MRYDAILGSMRRAAIVAAAAAAVLAATGADAPAAGIRYATIHHVCAPAGPRRAQCLALSLVPAKATTRGALPYQSVLGQNKRIQSFTLANP